MTVTFTADEWRRLTAALKLIASDPERCDMGDKIAQRAELLRRQRDEYAETLHRLEKDGAITVTRISETRITYTRKENNDEEH